MWSTAVYHVTMSLRGSYGESTKAAVVLFLNTILKDFILVSMFESHILLHAEQAVCHCTFPALKYP